VSKASQVIVLCEDKLQEVVVYRFLKKGWGITNRQVRIIPQPHGEGSGEKHVRNLYPSELRAYRTRKAKTILIAVIDADNGTVAEHNTELEKACHLKNIEPRHKDDAVMHLIPRRHIETWLAYLDGQSVNEVDNYKPSYEFKHRESDCHNLVDKLARNCKNNTRIHEPPQSLNSACKEFSERVRTVLKSD
jgi:hypothetical protein